MKTLRQLGLCAAIFAGLLFLYVGSYLGIYKNDLGRNIFGNTHQARGVAHLLHRAAAHFFAPLRYLEYRIAEIGLKQRYVGQWSSASGLRSLTIHSSGVVVLKGFDDMGAPDGSSGWAMWGYEGSADYGYPAVPNTVISSPDLPTALEVYPSGANPNEMQVWRAGYSDPEIVLRRTTSLNH